MKKLIVVLLLSAFPLRFSQEALPFIDTTVMQKEADRVEDHFDLIYSVVRLHEGNYVNHPSDRGGETYAGISRRSNPQWPGWTVIDSIKRKTGAIDRFTYIEQVEIAAKEHYHSIWLKEGFDQLINPNVAYYVFDTRIHHRSFIRLIGSVTEGRRIEYGDGWACQLGDLGDEFIERLRDKRIGLFHYLVRRDSSQQVFLRGWIGRAKVTEII